MVMGKTAEGFRMGLHVGPDLNQIYIPRRRRGSSGAGKKQQPNTETEPPLSMLEAAAILIEMANSVSQVELKKFNKTHKRKKPSTPTVVKKQRKEKRKQSKHPSIPEMPVTMRDRIMEMGGYEIRLVIQKQLQDTDLSKNHGRLLIPANQLMFDFATEEEKKLLSEHENKKKKGMNVEILDDVFEKRTICLKKWKSGSGDHVYCLMTQWNSLVKETGLKTGQQIQIWCFRKDDEIEASRLWFAMIKLD